MAMNYAWQERKKFAIPVAAGAAVLLIWYFFVLGSINARADNDLRQRRTAELQLRGRMQAGVPTEEAVGRAERDKGILQKDLKDIQEKLEFRIDDTFKVREGQSAASKFGRVRHEISSKIDNLRQQRAMEPIDPRLGFPQSVEQLPEPVLAEWLARLAIVQRVCLLSIESGVTGLKLVEVVPAEFQEEVTVPADRFMGVLSVKVKITGTADAIIRVLQGLQQEGPSYLALDAAEVTSADPTRNLLGASLTVGGLVVRPEGTLATEAKP